MAPSPEPPESKLQEMARQIRELQERVERLERRSVVEIPPEPALPLVIGEPPLAADTGKITALIGKALLALAFAYLLRALTEMKYLPLHAGVALGIVYALAWLLIASRADSSEKLTAGIRAISSTLILIPLLWEAQIRFQALSTWTTASVLVLFSIFGLGISWRKNLSAVAWVATLAGSLTMWVLLIATRDLAPFTCALIVLAVAVEVSAFFEHWLRERWIIAALADLAVVLVTYLVTQKQGLPEGYAAAGRPAVLTFQIALLIIYLSGTIARTVGRGFVITRFEIGQCVLAFVIAGWGALRVAQGHPAAVIIAGGFCIVCSVASYTVASLFRTRVQDTERNFYRCEGLSSMLEEPGSPAPTYRDRAGWTTRIEFRDLCDSRDCRKMGAMNEARDIPGAKDVVEWFGCWPTFHDSEVLHISLDRASGCRVVIRAFDGACGVLKYAIVTFSMEGFPLDHEGIVNTRIEGFNYQNVLSAAWVETNGDGYVLKLSGIFGVDGSIACRRIRVALETTPPGGIGGH